MFFRITSSGRIFKHLTKEKNQSLEKPIKISLENTAKIKSKDLKEKMVSATLVSGLDSRAEIVKVLSGYLALTMEGSLSWRYFASRALT